MDRSQYTYLTDCCSRLLSSANYPDHPRLVMGEGSFSPSLVLIGEAPGEKEAALGRPFVGKAGKNLDEFLSVLQLRREDIFITNVVKFRPIQTGTTGRISNRTPTKQEILAWAPILLQEIAFLHPALIVTLGNTPLHAVAGFDYMIGDVHGNPLYVSEGNLLFPLYHPAAIIYNRSLRETYLQDLQSLSHLLSRLPS